MLPRARFEEEVLPHLDAGYNLARWLARDVHDADDVVQEACVRALRYIDSLRPGSARSWFLTIVRHAYYDWRKANRPAELVHDAQDLLETMADPVAAVDPELSALTKADARTLAETVDSLPLPLREALVLRELEELSYKEIAQIQGVPIGTVMSRLARARASLQERSRQIKISRKSASGRV